MPAALEKLSSLPEAANSSEAVDHKLFSVSVENDDDSAPNTIFAADSKANNGQANSTMSGPFDVSRLPFRPSVNRMMLEGFNQLQQSLGLPAVGGL